MQPSSFSGRVAVLATASALVLSAGVIGASAAPKTAPAPSAGHAANADRTPRTGVDRSSALVRLTGRPLATAAKTRPARGKQLAFRSAAVRSHRAKLAEGRSTFARWLKRNAPQARVTSSYDVALNAVAVRLNGTRIGALRAAPGVTFVGYQKNYAPSADPDLSLIKAEAGWVAADPPGGASNAGTGVQVGVVDTGIDQTHPCFDDEGFPATTQRGDTRFTNNKVIVARVFMNKADNRGYTAEAIQDHGSHVAGTVACNYQTPASVGGADIPYDPSGVAPGAQLGNYNVFPGLVGNARSEDILNALQAAAEDGMDVINMSLGGDASGNQDLLTNAVNNLDRANIVVAVSAGNDGPGHYTVGSPGSAERALTAGASTVGHFVGVPISAGGSVVAVAAASEFAPIDADLTAPLSLATGSPLGNGCDAGQFSGTAGTIALVSRGVCTFSQKVFNAEGAGAVAVIVVNNVPGDPIAMSTTPAFPTSIPAVQAGLAARDDLVALAGQDVTIGADPAYVASGFDNIMANFSSQGPTDVDFRVKPDLVAPGVNVLSSVTQHSCDPVPAEGCWAFFQGTSMASPHLAGTAAVVRQAHPAWSAWQVRSAIVNTAQEGLLTRATAISTLQTDVQVVGAGLADVEAAVRARVALSSVSTSFGAIPSRNGASQTRAVTVTNLGGAALTLPVSVTGSSAFSVAPASVTLSPGASATLTVRFVPNSAVPADNQATLRLGDDAHSVLYAFVK